MGKAVNLAPAKKFRSMVILLSDGDCTYPEDALRQLFQEANRHDPENPLRLHTIQFCNCSRQEAAKQTLAKIAVAAQQKAAGDDFAAQSSYAASVDGIALAETFVGIA